MQIANAGAIARPDKIMPGFCRKINKEALRKNAAMKFSFSKDQSPFLSFFPKIFWKIFFFFIVSFTGSPIFAGSAG